MSVVTSQRTQSVSTTKINRINTPCGQFFNSQIVWYVYWISGKKVHKTVLPRTRNVMLQQFLHQCKAHTPPFCARFKTKTLITVAEVPRLRRPSSPCVLRSDRQDLSLTQPHKTKLQRGHSDCARRPIHLPVKHLSTHVTTQSAKRGVATSCMTCSSSKLPHWETRNCQELLLEDNHLTSQSPCSYRVF
jgi:hypothetical protein